MSNITVKPITETSISVRKKVVYLDMNGNWVAVSELSHKELRAFDTYKTEILDKGVKPLPEITYSFRHGEQSILKRKSL